MASSSTIDSTLRRLLGRLFVMALLATCSSTMPGCTDGPMFQMKKLSPWHQREWRKDRELGPTYSQRLEELALLKGRMASMSSQEKEQWATLLGKLTTSDTSPEMRAQAAQALAMTDCEATVRGLNAASTDKVEKVRLAVCQAWGTKKGEQARDMLLSMAKADESDDVRQAALAALGKFDDSEVRSLLVESLEHKNPAIQQQAVVSLRSITGRDFGGDFDAWKRYVNGEEVAEPQPATFTARVMQSIPWSR
jgi:hypothetical protein